MNRFTNGRDRALPFEELLRRLRQAADRERVNTRGGDAFKSADVISLAQWRATRKSARRLSPNILEQLPLHARIAALAEDVRSKRDQYRGIEPHALAELLGICSSQQPDGKWAFIWFQPRIPFDDIVSRSDRLEWMYELKEHVGETRYAELEAEADAVNAGKKDFQGEFLTVWEKQKIEQLFTEKELSDGGRYCLGFFTIKSSNGAILRFEALIEDDGSCIALRTPYDEHDGLFTNLDDGIVDI
jgi:hypothetical protein